MVPKVLVLGQQQGVSWETLEGMLLSAGALVLAVLAGLVALSYLRRKLFEEKRAILDDNDLTLGQARDFLKRGFINEEEFDRLREKILVRSREKLGELDKAPEDEKPREGQA